MAASFPIEPGELIGNRIVPVSSTDSSSGGAGLDRLAVFPQRPRNVECWSDVLTLSLWDVIADAKKTLQSLVRELAVSLDPNGVRISEIDGEWLPQMAHC
jgi:hypothetical protein